jgi:hypothetical protein
MQHPSVLLDRVDHYLAQKNWEGALKLAWVVLQTADGDWALTARAHLALAEVALGIGEPVDALNFTVGAQASALTAGDKATQAAALALQNAIQDRWGDWPAKELAADYARLLSTDDCH